MERDLNSRPGSVLDPCLTVRKTFPSDTSFYTWKRNRASRAPRFWSQLCHLVAVQSMPSHLSSLCLGFLTSKRGYQ